MLCPPTFSLDGKYLFFAASTNYGLNTGWLDMSSYDRTVYRNIYVAVLNKDDPSPFFPESDEETEQSSTAKTRGESPANGGVDDTANPNGSAGSNGPVTANGAQGASGENGKGKGGGKGEVTVKVDLPDIDQRILALPLPARIYASLQAADGGKLFYLESATRTNGFTLSSYDLKERKSETFLENIAEYWMTYNGKKLLYRGTNKSYAIVETKEKPKADHDRLKTQQNGSLCRSPCRVAADV